MAFSAQSGFGCPRGAARQRPLLALALCVCAFTAACQKQDDHPPYAAGCETNCGSPSVIAIGSGSSTPTGTPTTDAGFNAGTLTGSVVALADDSFVRSVPFTQGATVSATGSSSSVVSANWDGSDPYELSGVAVAATNWLSVAPAAQGDALQTYQAVQTNATDMADLVVVDTAVIDSVLTAVSSIRAPAFGQVVLFFRNAGTGAALSGIQAAMAAAEAPAYAAASGWVIPDDTTTTTTSGLVVFGNVEVPTAGSTTQIVTVSRPATATTAAISGGQFAIPVFGGAVTWASVAVQL